MSHPPQSSPSQTLRSLGIRERIPSSNSIQSGTQRNTKSSLKSLSKYSKLSMRNLVGKPEKQKNIIKAKKMRHIDDSPEKATSVVSICKTNLSRMNTGGEWEKAKEEILHHLYENHFKGKKGIATIFSQMIKDAKEAGIEINKYHEANLEDQLHNNFPSLLTILHCYRHKKDIRLVSERINSIKNTNPDQITHITMNKESRRDHVIVFQTLLDYIKNELFMINQAQMDLFMHLLVKEDILLLAAYEVFLFDSDIEEFVDSLFLIHRTRASLISSGPLVENNEISDNKEKQISILFRMKNEFKISVYNKMIDLISHGDMTTLELYNNIVKNGEGDSSENSKKFLKELTSFAENKIKSNF